ncbi:Flagellar basal body rod protein FlgB [Novipirellula aureliae]|uniref:Flagellar basal body rod protein FlgB n=1 Tax=Novipirellula aureliae TaxID=2527966 RepID=A0A5C6EDZ8_9BACT|nr:flagellar basal body protein [Novipirellula aureliae]TWU45951.1 Flagellar basal body rod protein FlgB [Novipirellula aureliae]
MLGIFQSSTIPALEQSLSFAQKRHELLAGNLANMDTPGYRSRDLDVDEFQNALAESVHNSKVANAAGRVGPVTRDDLFAGPRAATEQVVFHDGNDVSMENQIMNISKNQHLHSLAITTMRSQFALLRAAITERA